MAEAIIKTENLSYIYSEGTPYEHRAVDGVSIEIEKGSFVGLIGHTGSGKSTLMQQLNGLLKPTSGGIFYNGRDINDGDFSKKDLRSKVGLVFQYPEYQLFEATVFKDVCFGPKNQGLKDNEAGLRAFDALRQVGLPEELYYQSPFNLSGGEKRRAAIAGVLAMKPEVLILDEPTAGLDPQGRDELMERLAILHKENNITVILVSHSMEDVAKYVNRLIVMNQGEVIYDGAPKEVFSHYRELETMGLSAPQVTYIMNDLKQAGFAVNTNATTIEEAKQEILAALKNNR